MDSMELDSMELLSTILFFKLKENNKTLRECYEDHLIKKFKPELNRCL